jgi:dihydroorotate dehydrogenase
MAGWRRELALSETLTRLAFLLTRPILAALEPEAAHALTIRGLTLLPAGRPKSSPSALSIKVLGLDFDNPIGLAAGFDKNAEVPRATLGLGFGFVEVGTLTPRPQKGNPRPRLFRLSEDEAVINRLGFNNVGHAAAARRLVRLKTHRGIIGVNLGVNRDSADPIGDYISGLTDLGSFAHYVTINISSPNTPGLRALQARDSLNALAKALAEARAGSDLPKPILLKIAPDLDEAQLADIVEVAVAHGLDGLIISNTTVGCREGLRSRHAREAGGLSGRPLFSLSTHVLSRAARLAKGRLVLIGAGGVASGADAYAKIRSGASLVQLYTALVYRGPALVSRIKRELAALLVRDGFSSVSEAVGADLR